MTMPPLVLTTGEPAGVGPELTVQLLQRPLPSPLVIAGDPDLLLERAALLSLPLARKGDALLAPGGDGPAPAGSGPEQQPRRDEQGSELRCSLATLPHF